MWLPNGSKFSWDIIFMNFGNALCITKILALKILVLYRCSPASYMNITRQAVSKSSPLLPTGKLSYVIPITKWASHPIQSTRESMSSATHLGSLHQTESYHVHSSYLACTKCYSGRLALLSIAITIGRGTLMLQVHDDNVPVRNMLAVESVFG